MLFWHGVNNFCSVAILHFFLSCKKYIAIIEAATMEQPAIIYTFYMLFIDHSQSLLPIMTFVVKLLIPHAICLVFTLFVCIGRKYPDKK